MTPRIGIEHEYRVDRNGTQVNFREVIHGLDVPGARIDPGDRNAYRLPSGLSITCDGDEAEVASPPIDVIPGFAGQAAAWMAMAHRQLSELTEPKFTLTGVSTHISVSAPNDNVVAAAGMFCRTFAPAQMLLMDDEKSPGLLVRPRYGRVELGGEFVAGADLEAAAAMATGGVLVCSHVASGRRHKRALAPPVKVDVVASLQRYGWYVDRRSFGVDLYANGRAAQLRRELVGRISGQKVLEASWKRARRALNGLASESDLAAADNRVAATELLPSERPSRAETFGVVDSEPMTGHRWLVEPVDRPGYRVEPVAVSWDFTVVKVTSTRDLYISVPAREAEVFVTELEAGDLDLEMERRLAADPLGVTLATYDQACRRGVYDEIGPLGRLAPPERGGNGELVL